LDDKFAGASFGTAAMLRRFQDPARLCSERGKRPNASSAKKNAEHRTSNTSNAEGMARSPKSNGSTNVLKFNT
jgi:hypothetical protein